MHRTRSQVAEELAACIRCTECLDACPALPAPLPIETLNRETLDEPVSPAVMRFAQACYQCGACVPVCPVGLHRDAMMLWLKMRLLRGDVGAGLPMRAHVSAGPTFRNPGASGLRRTPLTHLTSHTWGTDEELEGYDEDAASWR